MALDPNIALGVRPMELANPLAQYGMVSQIQHAQNQNRLADMQMQEYQRTRAEEEGARNYLRGKDLTAAETISGLPQFGKTGLAYAEKLTAQRKSGIETESAQFKLANDKLKHGWQSMGEASTPQAAIEKLNDGVKNGYFDTKTAETEIAKLQNMPLEQYKQYRVEKIMGLLDAKDQLAAVTPKITRQEAGGQILNIQDNPMMPGYGLPVQNMAPIKKTATPGELMVDARARERLAAETATGALTPASLDLAANVYLQTGQLPTGMGKSASGLRSQVMNRATELAGGKPAAEVAGGIIEAKQDVAGRGKAVKDFSTGKQGDAVRSFNTAIDHLDTLSKMATALQNGDVRMFNVAGNAFAAGTGQAAPTDFDSTKNVVGSEVAKALTGSNMALKDREEIRDSLSRANSPAQLAGTVRRMQELMGGQLGSLKLQYETSTGRKDFDKKLTPRSNEVVQSLHGGQAAPGAAAPVKISGDADYNKLPSGALFIAPDGSQRRKP